ncbi:MAG: DUF1972 domain-containing protein [Bacteroidota bacterium]
MEIQKTKLAIIGTVGVPAKYGGFETLAHHLVLKLNQEYDITVFASKNAYPENERVPEWNNAKIKYLPFNANGIQSIIYDLWSIIYALIYCDVLLILGVSGCLCLPFIKLFSKKKIIVNIDGLEWRRPKWNWLGKKFLRFSEGIACKFADTIVTDNQMLKEYVKIQYSRESTLIEYGADHCTPVAIEDQYLYRFPFLKDKYAFKVARIEPENHIKTILEAFAYENSQQFVIVGNWDNSAYGRRLKNHYSQFSNLHLYDPIYDATVLNMLRSNAQYYVHGHSAGGTNPSLVEAMYLGLPILSFDVIYNRATTNNQAVYFNNVNELRQMLKQIEHIPLFAIGQNLRAFALKKYLWADISQRYSQLFDQVKVKDILLPEYRRLTINPAAIHSPKISKKNRTSRKAVPVVLNAPSTPTPLVSTNN